MRALSFKLALVAAWFFSVCACCAALNERMLLGFWATNNVDQNPPQNIILSLRSFGVLDANDLGAYLDSPRFKNAAAGSIWLLAPQSKPLEPQILDKYIAVYTATNSLVQRQFPPTESFSPEDSSQMLLNLGQFADRHPSELSIAVRGASSILNNKEIRANGKYMPPPLVHDSVSILLSAFKYELYSDATLSKTAATLLSEKLRGPWLVRREEVIPAVDFLLKDSKAEPDFLALQLVESCSANADSASVVLWLLVQSKDNPVAAKALVNIRKGSKNREILEGIESGVIGRQKAYDEPLQRRFPK